MRINEVYGHEPILSYQPEQCPVEGCGKIGTQCVDVSAAVTLTPAVTVGNVTVTCQGSPNIVCETNAGGTSCTVTLVQRVCVSIPVEYGVSVDPGNAVIACAEECCRSN